MKSKNKKPADVCLILEGTYPYVSGGVSTWVHQVISELPELTFSILFIGAERDPEAEYRYQIPDNVLKIEEFYIADPEPMSLLGGTVGGGKAVRRALDSVRQLFSSPSEFEDIRPTLESLRAAAHAIPSTALWRRRETWDLFSELLQTHLPEASCIDTFWTTRDLTGLLWKVLAAVRKVPHATVYHSVCTGYAGVLASLAAGDRDCPFLLSEHGIYVKERVAEIYRSAWIPEPPQRGGLDGNLGTLKRLWVGFFEILARIAYDTADDIVSLFGANADVQARFGADPNNIRIIPNGITPAKFDPIRTARKNRHATAHDSRPVVGFLGRVVSIKDVKTFLRAAAIVLRSRPDAIFRIIGPTGEEPGYHAECLALHAQLELGDSVEFTGQKSLGEALPGIDLMVLTSLSEGLPFVILEAYGTEIPVVATDVGSCRELIEGRPGDELGPGGIVTPVGKPEKSAAAILAILNNPTTAAKMGKTGRARAEAHYTSAEVFSEYGNLYKEMIATTNKTTDDTKTAA